MYPLNYAKTHIKVGFTQIQSAVFTMRLPVTAPRRFQTISFMLKNFFLTFLSYPSLPAPNARVTATPATADAPSERLPVLTAEFTIALTAPATAKWASLSFPNHLSLPFFWKLHPAARSVKTRKNRKQRQPS